MIEFFLLILVLFSVVSLSAIYLINPQVVFESDSFFEKNLMLFAGSSGEKTEKPTSKKLQDARKKGQVVKSQDVNNFVSMVASVLLISTFGGLIVDEVKGLMRYFFINSSNTSLLNDTSSTVVGTVLPVYLKVIIFIFIPLMITGVMATLAQVGFLKSSEGLKMQLNKLNPISGFKNMFSTSRLLSSLKNIILLFIISFMSYSFIMSQKDQLILLTYMSYEESLSLVGQIISDLITKLLLVVAIIAVVDYMIQRYQFMKNQKMTKEEIKQEYKQAEGDPLIKGKRRQKQREMSMGRMASAVSESTVIITNPTHFAIAIKYVHEVDPIPKVVAKGVDFKAQKIKELAKEKDIPIIENKPLARSLYKVVDIDQEIPEEFYKAIAEILATVYRLEKSKNYY